VDIGDIGAMLLEGPEQALNLVATLTDKLGEGVGWTGDQIQTFALAVSALAAKVEELQADARGDDEAAPPAAS
jgi:hypothetical protein